MKIIQKGRGEGKTTDIVRVFREHGAGVLLVASAPERQRVIRSYELTLDEQARVIVAKQDTMRGHHGEVFCDNLDWIVSMFLGEAVDVATVNAPSAPKPDIAKFKSLALEAVKLLDADRDAKCLKLLSAMAGLMPGYRADIDELFAAASGLSPSAETQRKK